VIPMGGSLQLRITPISLRSMGFCFSSVLAHASMARSAEKYTGPFAIFRFT